MRMHWIVAAICVLQVLSARGAEIEKTDTRSMRVEVIRTNFTFAGGSLAEWTDQVNKTFKVDLYKLGETDSELARQIRVPKMRLRDTTYWSALSTYNGLSVHGAEGLGKWILLGAPEQPSVIAYQPSPGRAQTKVKAHHLRLDGRKFEILLEIVEETRRKNAGSGPSRGSLRWHSEAGIVVAIGDESYLEIVSEIVNALKDQPFSDPLL